MARSALVRLLLVAAAVMLSAATARAQPVSLGFNCDVAAGPRLTRCEPLATTLTPDEVEALRRRLEGTPSCQLGDLEPGRRAQRVASFPDVSRLLTPEAVEEPYVTATDWVRRPDPEDLARYYPEEALREGLEGRAVIRCRVDDDGRPRNCAAVSEEPEGSGFGEATIRAAETFRFTREMRGCEVLDDEVRIPFRWVLPRPQAEPRRAPGPPMRVMLPAAPRPDVLLDAGLAALGVILALVGLLAFRRSEASSGRAGQPSIVERPSRRPPLWLLTPVGVGLAAWAVWRILEAPPQPAAPAARAVELPRLFLPDLDPFPWLLIAFVALVLLQIRLRMIAGPDARTPEWTGSDPRSAFWPSLLWVFTPEHRALGDRFTTWLVLAARLGLGLGLLSLVLGALSL